MTTDDTSAHHSAPPHADSDHGTRELLLGGCRAIAAGIVEVVTRRRRRVALSAALVVGVGTALLFRSLLIGADDTDGDETALAAALGLVLGSLAGAIPLTAWLTRASRRIGSATGAHPHWRDSALLKRSVDSRGRVTLAPGSAERVAVESRRAIASGAVGVPMSVILVVAALLATPVLLFSGVTAIQMLLVPFYALVSASTLYVQSLAAGRMALLRDAADAELALPESERSIAPPVDPPHGSRLP
ncbi:hypothetical protein DZG00_08760 [Clavibacter lycopersici]|uniref:Uncharacterized protein n=1 Tax=Clavibacter lycopersici TaxID=2301718 RepID=A0A399TBI8_9MICO|nr:hypothetical protein [Clavibacter lycopersici]RIJ51471.1 hypothetical protein DZG00_08760 [Clavibacter lycopersici]RIJ62318.1 hypothetical protein DZG02_02420 [Clavibacter lycopersici]